MEMQSVFMRNENNAICYVDELHTSVLGGRQSQSSCSGHFATGGTDPSILCTEKGVHFRISGNTMVSIWKILGLVGDCNRGRPSRSQSVK